ncbi:MAG: glycosyltransferase [Desulfobacterales bacterium]|nr:glycosyltransferase [Desulfobacterales bacterium]
MTYNGAETIRGTLQSCRSGLQQGKSPILVIDNASRDDTVSIIESLCPEQTKIVKMAENLGVACAFNVGVQRALRAGVRWLFILDQDSVCGPGCLDILLETAGDLVKKGEKVGAVCSMARSRTFPDVIFRPYYWTGRALVPVPDAPGSALLVPVDSTISSGTLYSVNALNAINGFRERYFIDFVDHECHIRLREAGWSLWWEKRAILHHRLGKIQRITGAGLWIEHEPFRYYYMTRNMTDGLWRIGGVAAISRFAGEMFRHVLRVKRYSARSNEIIYYIIKGIRDAILRRFGPIDSKHRF